MPNGQSIASKSDNHALSELGADNQPATLRAEMGRDIK
jgi:hypothetical protein